MNRTIWYGLLNLTIGVAGIYAMIVVFGIWLTLLMSFVAITSQFALTHQPAPNEPGNPFA